MKNIVLSWIIVLLVIIVTRWLYDSRNIVLLMDKRWTVESWYARSATMAIPPCPRWRKVQYITTLWGSILGPHQIRLAQDWTLATSTISLSSITTNIRIARTNHQNILSAFTSLAYFQEPFFVFAYSCWRDPRFAAHNARPRYRFCL